jgi:hypothetical protein
MVMEKAISFETSAHKLSLPTSCTIFFIYFLLIEVSAIEHGYLRRAESFLDVSSICFK